MSRYAGQHGRKAFGPGRKVSPSTQARYIAESIRQHEHDGRVRTVAQYTNDPATQRWVAYYLAQAA